MSDERACEQCGTRFTPRREHARFCSARCRVAWNRADHAHPAAGDSALAWAISAMADATDRMPRVAALDRARAFAVVSEAVWWVTIVDANLVRYHPDSYDSELTRLSSAERTQIEETLAGLRFVRNQLGHGLDHGDLISAGGRTTASPEREWIWNRLAEPPGAGLSPRGRSWEMNRHRAYQSRLAGRPVDDTFATAATFLRKVAAGLRPADGVRAAD